MIRSGYFAEQGDWPPVFIFALLLLLALVSVRPLFHTATILSESVQKRFGRH